MNSQTWTTKQLIRFSNSMSNAFGGGVDSAISTSENDTWTTQKLVNMSRSLARAYYSDF